MLGSKDLKPLTPEIFCLDRAIFLRSISFEAYFDPIKKKSLLTSTTTTASTSNIIINNISNSNSNSNSISSKKKLNNLRTDTALKFPGTKEYLDVEQYNCKLLVGNLVNVFIFFYY